MIIAILVEALASAPPQLDLNLICNGQYEETETSRAVSSGMVDGEFRTRTAVINTPVMRSGTAHLKFQGASGQLTYPDGRVRALASVTADARQITASYQRKVLMITFNWKVEVDRMTGAVRVFNGGDVAFTGACAPEPTQAKF